jgi:putative membrane protein
MDPSSAQGGAVRPPGTQPPSAAAASSRQSGAVRPSGFVRRAALTDLFEIQTSQAALKNSQNAEVRRFAQMMIDEHTKMSADLAKAVQSANLSIPIPTSLTGKGAQAIKNLSAISGAKFDAKYLKIQVQGHTEALRRMADYAQKGDNAVLRQYAQIAVPAIQKHLEMAQKMSAGKK